MLNLNAFHAEDVDAMLASVNWAQTHTIALSTGTRFSSLLLHRIFSHPQCEISTMELSKHFTLNDDGDEGEMDKIFAFLLEPCSAKLQTLVFNSRWANAAESQTHLRKLQVVLRGGRITKLMLNLTWSEKSLLLVLGSLLSSPGNQVRELHLLGGYEPRLLLPFQVFQHMTSEHCVLTTLSMPFGMVDSEDMDADVMARCKLKSVECAVYEDEHSLDFWGSLLQTPGSKSKLTSVSLRSYSHHHTYQAQSFAQALGSEHCKLEALSLTDIKLVGFKMTSPNKSLKRLVWFQNEEGMEFARSLPEFKSLTRLEITFHAERNDEVGLVLADWLESAECQLSGTLKLVNMNPQVSTANRLIRALRNANCKVERMDFSSPRLAHGAADPNALLLLEHTEQCMKLARVCLAMQSAVQFPRLGKSSALRRLPKELLRLVAAYCCNPPPPS